MHWGWPTPPPGGAYTTRSDTLYSNFTHNGNISLGQRKCVNCLEVYELTPLVSSTQDQPLQGGAPKKNTFEIIGHPDDITFLPSPPKFTTLLKPYFRSKGFNVITHIQVHIQSSSVGECSNEVLLNKKIQYWPWSGYPICQAPSGENIYSRHYMSSASHLYDV